MRNHGAIFLRTRSLLQSLPAMPCRRFLPLLLIFLLSTDPAGGDNQSLEPSQKTIKILVTAYGRGGHGSSLNPSSAPHRLIRAIDRISSILTERRALENQSAGIPLLSAIKDFKIQSLKAGEKINVTPDRAVAELHLVLEESPNLEELLAEVTRAIGGQVDLEVVASEPTAEAP